VSGGALEPPEAWVPDGRPRRLDPRWITVQRIAGAVFAGLMALVSLVAVGITIAAREPSRLEVGLSIGAWLAFVAGLVVWTQAWPALRYRHFSWDADRSALRIASGVVWRSIVTVPRSRVQHTDVQQGPIDRGFGLAALVVHTAGTQHASVMLSGLAHADALRLRDFLIEDRAEPADA
jgi:membrane protein YdbS with pleckstrin-like domain